MFYIKRRWPIWQNEDRRAKEWYAWKRKDNGKAESSSGIRKTATPSSAIMIFTESREYWRFFASILRLNRKWVISFRTRHIYMTVVSSLFEDAVVLDRVSPIISGEHSEWLGCKHCLIFAAFLASLYDWRKFIGLENSMSSVLSMQHFLYFKPLPQGHGSFLPIFFAHSIFTSKKLAAKYPYFAALVCGQNRKFGPSDRDRTCGLMVPKRHRKVLSAYMGFFQPFSLRNQCSSALLSAYVPSTPKR